MIGAGGVATVAAFKIVQNTDVFTEFMIASHHVEKCDRLVKSIHDKGYNVDIKTAEVDADDVEQLKALFSSYQPDLVINLALPYQDLTIMDACLACGCNYLDTANYEPKDEAHFEYSWQWAYKDKFEKAGLTAILGCGFDPGVSQAYTAYAAKHHFDEIQYLDIVDCNAGNHHKAFATNFNPEINIREITQKGLYYKDGKFYAGPPWDYDLTMGNVNQDFSSNSAAAFKTDGEFINNKLFYKYLCKNEWFMLEVRREYTRHGDYFRNIGAEGGLIDSLAAEYADVFERNYTDAGWKIRYLINVMMYPLPTYEENLEFFKSWCAERDSWLSEFYETDSLRFILGDCDRSGTIEIADVTLLQRYLAEAENDPEIALRGSVTGEKPSISDATEIQKYIAEFNTSAKIGEIMVK